LEKNAIPKEINHFRIGEAAFFGISPLDIEQFKVLSTNTFEFHANIIVLEEKKIVPDGVISDANDGHGTDFEESDTHETSVKAILDFGLLDVDHKDLVAEDKDISFAGITSDMLVIDLGRNKTIDGKQKYKISDRITFKTNYMAVARLLNSKFIDKRFE